MVTLKAGLLGKGKIRGFDDDDDDDDGGGGRREGSSGVEGEGGAKKLGFGGANWISIARRYPSEGVICGGGRRNGRD